MSLSKKGKEKEIKDMRAFHCGESFSSVGTYELDGMPLK